MTCISTMFKKHQGNTLFLRISIDAAERFFHTSNGILTISLKITIKAYEILINLSKI